MRAGEPRAEPGVECAAPLRLTQHCCGGAQIGIDTGDSGLSPGAGHPAAQRYRVPQGTLLGSLVSLGSLAG